MGMGKDSDRKDEYRDQIVTRTAMARMLRGLSQAKVAKNLGVSIEKYKTYEKRTPIPHYLIEPFTLMTGVSIEWLVTGEEAKQALALSQKRFAG